MSHPPPAGASQRRGFVTATQLVGGRTARRTCSQCSNLSSPEIPNGCETISRSAGLSVSLNVSFPAARRSVTAPSLPSSVSADACSARTTCGRRSRNRQGTVDDVACNAWCAHHPPAESNTMSVVNIAARTVIATRAHATAAVTDSRHRHTHLLVDAKAAVGLRQLQVHEAREPWVRLLVDQLRTGEQELPSLLVLLTVPAWRLGMRVPLLGHAVAHDGDTRGEGVVSPVHTECLRCAHPMGKR